MAKQRLKRFRQGSALVVAITALLLMFMSPSYGQDTDPPQAEAAVEVPDDPSAAVGEATTTLQDLFIGFYALLPKLAIAAVLLVIAWALTRLLRFTLHKTLRDWKRASAVAAIGVVLIWLVALGTALSVVAGDARALVGSVGLTGLALSWALQGPIESFTGWLLNSFRGYYRIGDRIAVGDVFGDVYSIDLLNTTVWEAGGPDKPVQGAQPTGALVTFPNSELLRAYITNYTRDFPYVWDEISFGVANESDLAFTVAESRAIATRVVGGQMESPAAQYATLLQSGHLVQDIASEPQVFLSGSDFWTVVTVRYLVPARERRMWASRLYETLVTELGRHEGRVRPPYVLERQFKPPADG